MAARLNKHWLNIGPARINLHLIHSIVQRDASVYLHFNSHTVTIITGSKAEAEKLISDIEIAEETGVLSFPTILSATIFYHFGGVADDKNPVVHLIGLEDQPSN